MPWQGWPPAPARPMVGDGRPTNSLAISVTAALLAQVTGGEVNLSLDLLLRVTVGQGGRHGVAERGVRPRRCQSPRAGLLGHEADRGVLHRGAGHAAD